eukprot:2348587-Lingulodinium_polyedra.AAC.1
MRGGHRQKQRRFQPRPGKVAWLNLRCKVTSGATTTTARALVPCHPSWKVACGQAWVQAPTR